MSTQLDAAINAYKAMVGDMDLLGLFFEWHCAQVRILPTDLRKMFAAADLDTKLIRDAVTPRAALGKAVKKRCDQLNADSKASRGKQEYIAKLMPAPVNGKGIDDGSVTWAIGLLDKDGELSIETALTASLKRDPQDRSNPDAAVLHCTDKGLCQLYEDALGPFTTEDIQALFKNIAHKVRAVRTRERTALHYCNKPKVETALKYIAVMQTIPGVTVITIPCPDLALLRRQNWGFSYLEFKRQLEDLQAELKRFKDDPDSVRESTLAKRLNEYAELREIITGFAEVMGESATDLLKTLDASAVELNAFLEGE